MSGALTRFFYGGFCQFWFTGIHNQSEGVVTREYGLLQEYLYSKIQTDNLSIPDRDSKALLYRILYYLSSGGRIFILVLSVCVCVEVFIPYDLIFFSSKHYWFEGVSQSADIRIATELCVGLCGHAFCCLNVASLP